MKKWTARKKDRAHEYDPEKDPTPSIWLALDDELKTSMVTAYHERQRIKLPRLKVHAAIHTIVENQIALGDEHVAKSTLARLMAGGLSRHDAVHAIGWVFFALANDAVKHLRPMDSAVYTSELHSLTAEKWLASGDEEE